MTKRIQTASPAFRHGTHTGMCPVDTVMRYMTLRRIRSEPVAIAVTTSSQMSRSDHRRKIDRIIRQWTTLPKSLPLAHRPRSACSLDRSDLENDQNVPQAIRRAPYPPLSRRRASARFAVSPGRRQFLPPALDGRERELLFRS